MKNIIIINIVEINDIDRIDHPTFIPERVDCSVVRTRRM